MRNRNKIFIIQVYRVNRKKKISQLVDNGVKMKRQFIDRDKQYRDVGFGLKGWVDLDCFDVIFFQEIVKILEVL